MQDAAIMLYYQGQGPLALPTWQYRDGTHARWVDGRFILIELNFIHQVAIMNHRREGLVNIYTETQTAGRIFLAHNTYSHGIYVKLFS